MSLKYEPASEPLHISVVGSQIVLTPTDCDMHEAEVSLIPNPLPLISNT